MKRVIALLSVLLLIGVNTRAIDATATRIENLESQLRFMESEIVKLEQDVAIILSTSN